MHINIAQKCSSKQQSTVIVHPKSKTIKSPKKCLNLQKQNHLIIVLIDFENNLVDWTAALGSTFASACFQNLGVYSFVLNWWIQLFCYEYRWIVANEYGIRLYWSTADSTMKQVYGGTRLYSKRFPMLRSLELCSSWDSTQLLINRYPSLFSFMDRRMVHKYVCVYWNHCAIQLLRFCMSIHVWCMLWWHRINRLMNIHTIVYILVFKSNF